MYEFGRKKGRDFDERKRSQIYKLEITEGRKEETSNLRIRKKRRDLEFPNSERKKKERKRSNLRIWKKGIDLDARKRSRIHKFEVTEERKKEIDQIYKFVRKKGRTDLDERRIGRNTRLTPRT